MCIKLCTQVLPNGLNAEAHNNFRRAHERIPFDFKSLEVGQAADGVGKGRNGVVADVEGGEGGEEAEGVREGGEVVEVLADVEGLELGKVLEIFGEGPEAVEMGVEGPECHHVGGGGREVSKLVGVHGEATDVC